MTSSRTRRRTGASGAPTTRSASLNYLDPRGGPRGARHIRPARCSPSRCRWADPEGDPVWPGRTGAVRNDGDRRGPLDCDGKGPQFAGGLHYADDYMTCSCRAPRSTTRWATSGTTARSGTATTPGPPIGGLDKASVLPIAEQGVVGRGILLDMARYRGKDGARQGRDVHPRGPRGLRPQRRASRSRSATSWSSAPAGSKFSTSSATRSSTTASSSRASPTARELVEVVPGAWRSRTSSPTPSPTRSPSTRCPASCCRCTAR